MAVVFRRDLPTEIRSLRNESEEICIIPFAQDTDDGRKFSVFTALSPYIGTENCMEIAFYIINKRFNDGHAYDYLDGKDTKSFITSREDRLFVLNCVLTAVSVIVDKRRPPALAMVTTTPHLPDRALEKFRKIAAMVRQLGYKGGTSDIWHGQHIWMFERLTA